MNPVLLKPTTNVGSQVIVHGRAVGTMAAREYFGYRASLMGPIMESYHALEHDYDVVIIEGAGSPVELNLKRDDIVNMGIAKACRAPVMLVGDIDRGGVFAQLVGTLMLMEADATVTICHTGTVDMPAIVRAADIVIVAAGRMETIGGECFRPGQTVIDVGIGWNEAKGKLCGDVKFEEAEPVVDAITPVPGGVGAVTTSVLVSHVVEAAERTLK
jgi:hypothetical protein